MVPNENDIFPIFLLFFGVSLYVSLTPPLTRFSLLIAHGSSGSACR